MLNKKMKLSKDIFLDNIKKIANRDGFGEGLVVQGRENKKIVALSADLAGSTKLELFKKNFKSRYIEVGVAEQNLMGVASGVALSGKIPFIGSFAVFSPGRNWDQLRVSVCYSKLPVKMVSTHAGLNVGPDGATHQALEDIALTRVLPNLKVVIPCDYEQAKKSVKEVSKDKSPVYVRLARTKTPIFTTSKTPFKIGKADIYYSKGIDATIIGAGPILYECLLAAKELEKSNIKVKVVNLHTIKPLDEKTIIDLAKKTKAFVVAEEHQQAGGVFGAVSECVCKNFPIPIESISVNDSFGESGSAEELLQKYGLTKGFIVKAVKKVLKRSSQGGLKKNK